MFVQTFARYHTLVCKFSMCVSSCLVWNLRLSVYLMLQVMKHQLEVEWPGNKAIYTSPRVHDEHVSSTEALSSMHL